MHIPVLTFTDFGVILDLRTDERSKITVKNKPLRRVGRLKTIDNKQEKQGFETEAEKENETVNEQSAPENQSGQNDTAKEDDNKAETETENSAEQNGDNKADELNDRLLRLSAEFDNFRKRTQKEKDTLYKDAQAETIGKFLEVLDNLERAAAAGGEDSLAKGVEMVINQFKDILNKMGVTEIDPAGEAFNPDLHYAVSHIEDENLAENIVANVFQKGYIMGDRVVRFAMVQVAN